MKSFIAALSMIVASSCVLLPRSFASPRAIVADGIVRVTGQPSEGYPCDALKPFLLNALEFGIDTCKAVPLTFTRYGTHSEEIVFDLWLVTRNESIAAGADSDVVDFYERVTLGEIGDEACGRFKFERYFIGRRSVTVLSQHVHKWKCPNV